MPKMHDRHADLADLTRRKDVVGVIPGLCRQVERYGQAGLALLKIAAIQRI